jgi:carbon-monoxide dehydrogenase medium subunit
VKLPPFAMFTPGCLDAAIELLVEHGDEARLLAGGQSLVPLMAFRLARPSVLIDLSGVEHLRHIRRVPPIDADLIDADLIDADHITIGAMVTQREAERSATIGAIPLVAEALPHIAHVAIRSQGTIGGSVAHSDPAGELPLVALAGEAVLTATGPNGTRYILARDFSRSFLTTALAPTEILTELRWPVSTRGEGTAMVELARRPGDFALVAVATMLQLDSSGTIRRARLAFGAMDTIVRRADAAEQALVGTQPSPSVWRDAAELAVGGLEPADDVHASATWRRHVAVALAAQALELAGRRAALSLQYPIGRR